MWDFMFFFNSVLLGVGLAMDAFSVSLANGLNEPCMRKRKMCGVAGVFAFFALLLLGFIGGKMLVEGIKNKEEDPCGKSGVGFVGLLVQGVATSIDALSVGFTIAEYELVMALVSALIIAAVTFGICMLGLFLGKKFGTKLSNKATVFGGAILILIGIEIFVTGLVG